MAIITYTRALLVSLVGSVLLTRFAPQQAPFASWFFNFLTIYVPIVSTLLVAKAFVYPHLLSPLRDLPMPKVRDVA
jgi:predicted permease